MNVSAYNVSAVRDMIDGSNVSGTSDSNDFVVQVIALNVAMRLQAFTADALANVAQEAVAGNGLDFFVRSVSSPVVFMKTSSTSSTSATVSSSTLNTEASVAIVITLLLLSLCGILSCLAGYWRQQSQSGADPSEGATETPDGNNDMRQVASAEQAGQIEWAV